MQYDPSVTPDPEEWLSLDEQERLDLVASFHEGTDLPNLTMHAVTHVIVENQLAMGDVLIVNQTLDRLIKEGLDRHNAIHAIGSSLMEDLLEMTKSNRLFSLEEYKTKLDKLSASKWMWSRASIRGRTQER